ncbi:hypothetical protein [Cyanobium sp. WAJ14-Wanaka]|uniref:hypothetical protein n=1 Tax=Cyanobium sp. WAJ14-Wanaka TaxID=2823725 RepID=UPI0020CF2EB1|nr:hypothetical protein [Cyanobium sp. WAJ14-Wanaka]MCP9775406.1 hypothetical protein [Cyanobium sp. WAJ14-Wanaka]
MRGLQQPAFWLPLACGGAITALVAGFAVVPQFQQWQQEEARLMALREQVDQLPSLRRQLTSQQERLERAQQQQDLLLQLIAGSGNLATFLAQADQLANRTGVELSLYEPQPQGAAPQPLPAAQADPKGAKAPQDPLAVDGLQKRTVLLAAKGHFSQLWAFLQGLERLNLLVVQSDLLLSPEEPKAATGASAPGGSTTGPTPPGASIKAPASGKLVLRLNVSFYGRTP